MVEHGDHQSARGRLSRDFALTLRADARAPQMNRSGRKEEEKRRGQQAQIYTYIYIYSAAHT